MPAVEWATPPQKAYLVSMLPKYREVHATKNTANITRFFVTLDCGWFSLFPVEVELGITPAVPGGPPLSAGDLEAIGKATVNTKARLRAWMRYRAKDKGTPAATVAKHSSLFKALQVPRPSRAYRSIEVYHKLSRNKVRALVDQRGYGLLNEESEAERTTSDPRVLTPEEETQRELEAVERIKKNRAARMSLFRNAAIELFAAETEEVLAEIEAAKNELNAGRIVEDENTGSERTPEEYQHSIDQLGAVAQLVMSAIECEAGWHGMLVVGGPNPRRLGAVTMKTFCFGATPLGLDFAASYPDFADFKSHFAAYLKRAFPHEVRDQRALLPMPDAATAAPVVSDRPDLEGMIPFETNSSPEPKSTASETINPHTPILTTTEITSHAPKRVRRKKVASAASPVMTAPAAHDLVVMLPTPTTPATPNLTLSVPVDFDHTINDMLSNLELFPGSGEPYVHLMADHQADRTPGSSHVGGYSFPTNDYPFPTDGPVLSNYLPLPSFPPPTALPAFTSKATFPQLATVHTTPPISINPGTPTPVLGTSTFGSIPPELSPASSPAVQLLHDSIVNPHTVVADLRARLELDERDAPIPAASLTHTVPRITNASTVSNTDEIPQYPESRPMANPPSGHPLAKQSTNTKAAAPHRGGRPPKTAGLSVANVEVQAPPAQQGRPKLAAPPPDVLLPLTGPAACAESARIHRVEKQLRADHDANLQRGKEIDAQTAAVEAEKKRLAALVHNPAGGADLVIITRPRRNITAHSHPDGSAVIFPVIRTHGDTNGVSLLGRRVQAGAADAAQQIEDAKMLKNLERSKSKHNGGGVQNTKGTKRKAAAAGPAEKPLKKARR
ncbi:hypothetical protein MSAN_01737300 [Mycena sanguinolenta]|uniref:Uncharacterized protein n=1 Tax=Mycena sanguinolenta TaxID=230812 RepID=A0A8H6XWE7_9AGAR|nr:hypothetical protein MSAN_01737300 [Mycena sanguinolenta]